MTGRPQELINLVSVGESTFSTARDPDGATRVSISGHLLNGNRSELKQLVVDQLERGDRAFVLDLLRCGYVDSAGCGVIVSLSWKIKQAGGPKLRVEGLNEDLTALFKLTGLDTLMDIETGQAKETP